MANVNTLGETIKRIIDSRVIDLHTALPGRVKSYDASKQTADIEAMISRQIPTGGTEDPDIIENLPVLPSIPVLFLSAGGFFVSLPLQVDDPVLIIFCERDINHYRATGNIGDPSTPQTHSLNGAVCIPVNFSQYNNNIQDVSTTNMVLGKDGGSSNITITTSTIEVGGSSDAATLDSKLQTELGKIKATLDSLTGQASFTVPYTKGSTASSKIKTNG